MSETVTDVSVLVLRFDFNVVLISLSMVVVVSDGSIETFFFPFDYVFKGDGCIPGSVGNESVLVGECPHLLAVNVAAGKADIRQGLGGNSADVEVGIDTRDTASVGAIEIGDGIPDFALDLEVVFEVVDDLVVLVDIGFVVVLVEFAVDKVG